MRAGTAFQRAWDEIVPAPLAARCLSLALTRGVLTVKTSDASTRFELDRFLRCGGEAKLARAAKIAIRKIKLT